MAGGVLCVVFTDLVGSTELMTRLGDVAFDTLRAEHFAQLREVIAGAGGTEVKNTGDGLLATFTSAVEALAAAVRIQQATDRQGRSAGVPMAVRVGLALGEVGAEDGDVFGTPVVEAARLVAAAHPGQILATALVRAVAGTRTGVLFTDVGSLELKGLSDPVPVCDVGWEPLDAGAAARDVPLPGLLLRTGRIFVGRDAELDRLRGGWKEASGGGRALVLLGGEPGIGKTRLAAALAAELHAEGAVVLAGRCDEDMGVPYQPFVEALRHYVTHAPAPLRLGRHPGELTRLIPELAGLAPGLPEPLRSDPETERYRLFDAIAAWLADVSTETPALLVLDDLHWAARPTLQLLRHILRSDDPMRLLVVATYRDTETAAGDPFGDLLADLPRMEGTARLPVSGLDPAAVAAYVEAAAGHELDEQATAMAETVWRETQGNCFFVAEVLRHLAESGAFEERDGRWTATVGAAALPIPDGVRAVVARRLSRLPQEARQLLETAAVAGLEFDPTLVRAAAGFAEDDVLTALDAAVAARLVVDVPGPVPRNRFTHALVRSTLYDGLTAARRRSLHRRTAEAIEMIQRNHLDDHLPALAHHWAQAGTDPDKAVDYATRAGQRALDQLAFDEAAAFLAQSLPLVGPDDTRRVDLLIVLGEAQRRAGDPLHRQTLLEAGRLARARGDADAMARAALANTRGVYYSASGLVDEEKVAALEEALAVNRDAAPPVRARLLATLGLELGYTGDRHRGITASDDALALARQFGDPATLTKVLLARFYTINSPLTLGERLANTAELLELAEQLGDPQAAFLSAWQRARVSLEAGDAAAAADYVERAESLAGVLGQPTFRWFVGWNRVGLLVLAGRIDEADRLYEDMNALGLATGQPDSPVWRLAVGGLLRYEQSRLAEIEAQAIDFHRQSPSIAAVSALVALIYSESGRLEDARRIMDPMAAAGFDFEVNVVWLGATTLAAEVIRALGDTGSAAVLYDLLLPHSTTFGVLAGLTTGCTAYYLGLLATMLGRFPEAEEHFRVATEAHIRVGAPAHLGRTRVEWARMRLARRAPGDVEEAQRLLQQALTVATDLGLVNVERRARAVMEMP
jgi:class 3 adenylate cyclase/tetratricopeptide (TPR) repeat protein